MWIYVPSCWFRLAPLSCYIRLQMHIYVSSCWNVLGWVHYVVSTLFQCTLATDTQEISNSSLIPYTRTCSVKISPKSHSLDCCVHILHNCYLLHELSVSCWLYRYLHYVNPFSLCGYTGTLRVDKYPLSYGVPVRERYGTALLPATREQHDQNCTQSH